ncbi:DUF4249 domain-containing protein [Rufibacter sp. XAAS-G3-1]|uniref:DUF4249 domain-containing protein n=1 Tax=Rufibacter sp. XAAS-G3-1 TaxID=2729134 RepID=UPI0015E774E4|nr:DUF4249 domain-containing protein [Rufibacter sp. XAAS-G3-1]
MSFYTKYLRNTLFLYFLFLLTSCEEPFTPEVLERPNNFLVVSGFINSNGPTAIKLSRTQNLSEEGGPAMETRATVTVAEENGPTYLLRETAAGTYTSGRLPIQNSKRYRLVIKAGGKDYASDYVEVKQTPVIDKISWQAESDGLQFMVTTHDDQNNTRFYRWEYEETWEYRAYYYSEYEYVNGEMQYRRPENDIYLCWQNNSSKNILINNTVKLSQDVVSNYPLLKLPANSDKLANKYSLLVKQYAQSKESYEYWDALKKNTENIGTLFDPLPTQLTGNITCLTDPAEPVIGFINISSVEEKRIFVNKSELPTGWRPPSMHCTIDTVAVKDLKEHFSSGFNIPVSMIYSDMGAFLGYSGASSTCADCRVYGTKTKPDFWQ